MRKFKFEKVSKVSVLDTIYFEEEWMSGDADAFEYVKKPLSFKYSELNKSENLEILYEHIKNYTIIAHLTDINHKDYAEGAWGNGPVVDIKTKYGEVIEEMYEEAPNDTASGDGTANLHNLTLKAIDKNGMEWECLIELK